MALFGRKKTKLTVDEWRSFEEEQRSITSIPGYWPEIGSSGQAVASVSRALSLAPVVAAARLIADMVASLPPVLYTRDKRGIPRRQPTPSLFAQPSIHGTLYDWLFRAAFSMAVQGDAIGLVTARDYYGLPTMIEWLNPEQVATQDGKLYGPGSYMNPQWWWWGRPINPRELVHIPWFTMPWRVRGLSPIGCYQLWTNIGIGASEFSANWFGQGGVPPGVFKNAERVIDHKDADKLTARLTARLQSRQPLVIGRDWDYTAVAIKPNEAQFIETMQLTATNIAVIYGLPPEKIGGATGAPLTYNTVELNNIDLLTHSLRPWLVRFEHALTRCFPKGYFVKFDVTEMLRVDAYTQAQIDALSLGFQQRGWMDQDEVRARRDLPPLPKPEVPQPVPAVNGKDSGLILPNSSPTTGAPPKPPPNIPPNTSSEHGQVSNVNQLLADTPKRGGVHGRQALVQIMAMRGHDPVGRVNGHGPYMRERV
jgi:HK97 family phage portal protein